METKLGSYRVQDRADVVQVLKVTTPATVKRIRKYLGKAHAIYLQRFEELPSEASVDRLQISEVFGTARLPRQQRLHSRNECPGQQEAEARRGQSA